MHILFNLVSLAAIVLLSHGQETAANLQPYTISAPGINASYIGYRARLTSLFVKDKNGTARDIVLGYDEGSQYINDTEHDHTYFGAVSESLSSLSSILDPPCITQKRRF